MNKIYRIVWSSALGLWVVASETTRSRKKGRVRRALNVASAAALSSALLSPAMAADETVNWSQAGVYQPAPDKDGAYDDFGYFATLSDAITAQPDAQHKTWVAGTNLTINGPVPNITMGTNGTSENKTLKELLASGAMKSITDSQGNAITIDNIDQYVVSSGYNEPAPKTGMDLIIPGTNGSVEQITIYNSDDFQNAGTRTLGDITVAVYDFDSIYQYNHFGISHVTDDGGDVTVDLGADTNGATAIADAQNTLRLYTKNTELTRAEGAQGSSSQTHWESDNYIQFGAAIALPTETTSGSGALDSWNKTIEIPTFSMNAEGNVVAGPARTFTVNTLSDIAQVNDFLTRSDKGQPTQLQLWLVGEETINGVEVKDATGAQSAYQTIIQALLDARQSQNVNWTYNLWSDDQSHSGNATQGAGTVSVIFATGKDALGEITKEGSLAVSGSHQGVVHAEEGAEIINNGALNTWNETGARADAMYASDATATNNGTLNAGLFIEKDGTRVNHIVVSNVDIINQGSIGIFATTTGSNISRVTNNGILNVALADNGNAVAEGIHAEGNTTAVNNSAVNVVNGPRNTLGSATAYGVNVLGNSTFTNASSGTIKLGVQLDSSSAQSDDAVMAGGSTQSAAVRSQSTGDVINEGMILLGKYVRNAVGMLSDGGKGRVINNGQMERAGSGTTVLLGDNTYTGQTTIDTGAAAQVGNGGIAGALSEATRILDNGLFTINLSKVLTLGGVISGSGSFHQDGRGLTRLNGDNSYAGETRVNQGSLIINGNQSAAGGDVTVADSTLLGGHGTIGGNVVMGDTATLQPGDGGTGTLFIANNKSLTLGKNTLSDFEFGEAFRPGGNLNDLVDVAGDLTLGGTLNVSTSSGGSFGPGVYRIYNYGGSLHNDGQLKLGSLPAGTEDDYYVQTNINHEVNLVNDGGLYLQFWDGAENIATRNHGDSGIEGDNHVDGGDGVWMSRGDAGDNNWTTASGKGNAPWAQYAWAIFQSTPGTVTVDDKTGDVHFAGAQFVSDGYVVKGDALHAVDTLSAAASDSSVPSDSSLKKGDLWLNVGDGTAGSANSKATIESDIVQTNASDSIELVKGNTGVLILKGNNDYLGGTRIEGGTLQVQGNQNLGAADTTVTINNNSTLQNGADWETSRGIILGDAGGQLDLNSHALKEDGVISGKGKLTVRSSTADADSLLTLLGDNTYQGGTAIIGTDHRSDVVVDAQTSAALGLGSSEVGLSHGATLNVNNASSTQTHNFTVDDSLLTLNDASRAADSVIDITHKGEVQFNDSAQGGNAQINVGAGTTLAMNDNADAGQAQIVNKGRVSFSEKAQGRQATVSNQQGGVVNIAGADGDTDVGSLFGAGNVELGANTLHEGALSRDDAISGIISGANGSLVKEGDGTLTLTGDNTYTGTTHVEQGVLLVNGNQHAATGDVTVDAGTTLGGDGIIGGAVSIADNGHIAAGADLNSVGKLTTGSLTFSQNSQLDYQLGEAYIVGGKLNDLIDVKGDLNLDGKLNITETNGGSFGVGVYRLINYTGSLKNNVLDIASAPEAADSLYVQTSVNHQVNLVNRAGLKLRFWDGAGGKDGVKKNNNVIDGGDGIWQSGAGNDNWTTDGTNPSGALNAQFDDDAFAVFEGDKGTVTVDKSLGEVWLSGAQFATDGYVVQGDALNTHTADTILRVGDGTVDGVDMTTTINSVIQGTGGIDKTDVGTLVLNGVNTYSGGTTVSGGVLNVSADNSLGVHDTTLTLNGGALQYGKGFDTDRQVTLGEDGGGIDTNGIKATLSTALTGNGKLTKLGKGTLTLTANSKATGGTTIDGGVLQLGNGGTTGALIGNIEDNTALAVNRSNTLTINGEISGKGEVQQIGSGTTVLTGDNSYSGITRVVNGILRAGGTQTLSENSVHTVYQGALLDTQGYNQQIAGMNNAGTVNLTGGHIGSALTVKGNYVGDEGTINLAAQQKGSEGTADKLVIDGGKASGQTKLNIDISRLGAPTHGNGIEVVEALNGATTTAQSTRDAFTLGADHLEAGAFEYHLFAGDLKAQGDNWYLRTDYRSEVPLFNGIAQAVRTGDLAVLSNLHKRMGDENSLTKGNDDKRVWARYLGEAGRTRLNDAASTSLNTHMNGVQVGSDIWTNQQWKTGLYASLLDNRSSIYGEAGGSHGYVGDIKEHALYLGGYATWTADNGFWVDNVLQYGRHDLSLKTSGKSYKPNGNSFAASVEIGKPYQLGESRWQLEPQAQLIWQHSSFDDIDVKGDTKTKASINAGDSVTGRIGTRLVGHYQTRQGEVTPYVRVNLWQGMGGSDNTRFSNSTATTKLTAGQRYSSTEAAAGATWSVKPDLQFYGEVGREWSNKGGQSEVSKDVTGSIGFKGHF